MHRENESHFVMISAAVEKYKHFKQAIQSEFGSVQKYRGLTWWIQNAFWKAFYPFISAAYKVLQCNFEPFSSRES